MAHYPGAGRTLDSARRVTTMVDNADLLDNPPAIARSADAAKWRDVVVLIVMVIGDILYAITCCSHKAPVYKSTCSHKLFVGFPRALNMNTTPAESSHTGTRSQVYRRGGLLIAVGQLVSLIWLTSVAFPILQRLYKLRCGGRRASCLNPLPALSST